MGIAVTIGMFTFLSIGIGFAGLRGRNAPRPHPFSPSAGRREHDLSADRENRKWVRPERSLGACFGLPGCLHRFKGAGDFPVGDGGEEGRPLGAGVGRVVGYGVGAEGFADEG
jgi:hypothetical protein